MAATRKRSPTGATRRNPLRDLETLERWADRAELPAPLGHTLALYLYDVSLAVRRIDKATRRLIADRSTSPRDQGDLLNSIRTAVYSALPSNVKKLRTPLDQAIRHIYANVEVDEETLLKEARRDLANMRRRLKRQDPVRERYLADAKKAAATAARKSTKGSRR